ncbi:hypothetical protein [Bacillus fonticola]|uniref:hypothetical protein n=1 Tax=Bacillus fonticola TaxID=2728853 RepID=UPI0014729185|nr:hypothetical protein [Bacillus fonticola]
MLHVVEFWVESPSVWYMAGFDFAINTLLIFVMFALGALMYRFGTVWGLVVIGIGIVAALFPGMMDVWVALGEMVLENTWYFASLLVLVALLAAGVSYLILSRAEKESKMTK